MIDGIKIEGLDAVKAKLEGLATDKADRCIRRALRAGAELEKAAIEAHTPVRPPLPSGTALPPGAMKADTTFSIQRGRDGNLFAVVKPGDATYHVRLWVEEGHRLVRGGYSKEIFKNGEGTGKYRGPGRQVKDENGELVNVPPHPYTREAYEESREEVAQAIAATLSQEIDKVAKR